MGAVMGTGTNTDTGTDTRTRTRTPHRVNTGDDNGKTRLGARRSVKTRPAVREVRLPWSAFQATYRGRRCGDARRPLDVASIRRVGIMMRR